MDDYIKIIFLTSDAEFNFYLPAIFLVKTVGLKGCPKPYTIIKHTAHSTRTKKHYHIYSNGKIGVVNEDGSGSHGTCPKDLPRKIKDFLRDSIGVPIPENLPVLDSAVLENIFIKETFILEEE